MLCLPSIVFVALALTPPASAPAGGAAPADGKPAELPADGAEPLGARGPSQQRSLASAGSPADGAAPLSGTARAGPAPASALPSDGVAPLRTGAARRSAPATAWPPASGVAPLDVGIRREPADPRAPAGSPRVAAPFGTGPSLKVDRPDPRTLRAVRIDLLVGAVWRIRTAESLFLASVEAGRLQGFSGIFHVGMIVAPDRAFVGVHDFPIGAGFVARRPLGKRSLSGSVGLTAGILVHRAATDLGVLHRVDPDFQLPLRFAWTVGRVGLSVALLQGFSVRNRTYYRRGVEVWQRIGYRIGFAIGLHFDVGVGRAGTRRSARRRRETP